AEKNQDNRRLENFRLLLIQKISRFIGRNEKKWSGEERKKTESLNHENKMSKKRNGINIVTATSGSLEFFSHQSAYTPATCHLLPAAVGSAATAAAAAAATATVDRTLLLLLLLLLLLTLLHSCESRTLALVSSEKCEGKGLQHKGEDQSLGCYSPSGWPGDKQKDQGKSAKLQPWEVFSLNKALNDNTNDVMKMEFLPHQTPINDQRPKLRMHINGIVIDILIDTIADDMEMISGKKVGISVTTEDYGKLNPMVYIYDPPKNLDRLGFGVLFVSDCHFYRGPLFAPGLEMRFCGRVCKDLGMKNNYNIVLGSQANRGEASRLSTRLRKRVLGCPEWTRHDKMLPFTDRALKKAKLE
ncbi:hypothetical protein U0070_010912, partial [Myodes glareolus]